MAEPYLTLRADRQGLLKRSRYRTSMGLDQHLDDTRSLRQSPKERIPMQGKTVVITGGTSGIGEIAAERLAQMGTRIVLIARSKFERPSRRFLLWPL
jgi:NADPH:quinone reductase-like Zn-dependent oxidoreductase